MLASWHGVPKSLLDSLLEKGSPSALEFSGRERIKDNRFNCDVFPVFFALLTVTFQSTCICSFLRRGLARDVSTEPFNSAHGSPYSFLTVGLLNSFPNSLKLHSIPHTARGKVASAFRSFVVSPSFRNSLSGSSISVSFVLYSLDVLSSFYIARWAGRCACHMCSALSSRASVPLALVIFASK